MDNNSNLNQQNISSKITISTSKNKNIYGTLGNKYILISKIGKGLSSKVFSAKKKDSPSRKVQFAIKICKKKYDHKMFIEEGHIHKKLPNSPYLIKYIDSKKDILIKSKNQKQKQVIYHIFEYYENGNLSNYINLDKNIKGFGEILGRIIFKQILNSVELIHKNGFGHQDIKLENILISSNFNFKLSDFGFAKEIFPNGNNQFTFSHYGTNGYFPPEIYINRNIDPIKSDIFALGVSLFIIVSGIKPFNSSKRNDNLYKKIWRKNYDSYWNEFSHCELSKSFKEFIMKFFVLNVNERIKNVEEIKNEKWINEGKMDFEYEREILKVEMEKRKKIFDDMKEYC